MTSSQYAASRPDLAVNWQRAHDSAWIAANPSSIDVVNMVRSYPTFTAYLLQDYQTAFPGMTFSDTAGAVTLPLGGSSSSKSNSWVWWVAAGGGLFYAWKKGWLKF